MGKSIDRDKAIKALGYLYNGLANVGEVSAAAGVSISIDIIKTIGSYNDEPVAHGEWEENHIPGEPISFKCSVCGERITFFNKKRFKYCNNCGAKMDLERTP